MGKGDIKTKKGKIAKGTFGVTRSRKRNRAIVVDIQEKAKKQKSTTKKKSSAKKEK